ncbi:MAG: transcriptional repressor [Muribaculaceae bacterium]|nr:transcriptional repressor [Muribaculaceae bacterium]
MRNKKVTDTLPDSVVIENFDKFLKDNGKRRTPERSMILESALEFSRQFTVEDLVEALSNKNFIVSKATIYNTVLLLVEAGVFRQFSVENRSHFERADNVSFIHLMCEHCGKVKLVKDTNFMAYMNARRFPAFTTSYYNFTVYGVCNDCARKIKQAKRKRISDKKVK